MKTKLARFWNASKSWPLRGQFAMAALVIFIAAVVVGAVAGDSDTGNAKAQEPKVDTSVTSAAVSPTTQPPVATTSTAAAPTTTTTSSSIPALAPPEPATESATLTPLAIAPATHQDDYHRDLFGGGWIDGGGDCQDTRAEVLIAESSTPPILDGCSVFVGAWDDPWSTESTTNASDLDIDHTVPLANAWRSGAWAWTGNQRIAYANELSDADHLNAIPLTENRSKSDDGPEAWRPPDQSSWCRYAQAWTRIKARWNLSATQPEWDALVAMSAGC